MKYTNNLSQKYLSILDSADYPPRVGHPIAAYGGEIICRVGDDTLALCELVGARCRVSLSRYINSLGKRKNFLPENKDCLTSIVNYLVFGPRRPIQAVTLVNKVKLLIPIIKLCDESGIPASDLHKYPSLIRSLHLHLKSKAQESLQLLAEIFHSGDYLDFFILTESQINEVLSRVEPEITRQTPYIPDRIFNYQLSRIKHLIQDYIDHEEAIHDFYDFCLEKFESNYGNLQEHSKRTSKKNPFGQSVIGFQSANYYGSFSSHAEAYGIARLIEKWVLPESTKLSDVPSTAAIHFSQLLSGVVYAGAIYLASHTAMRRGELSKLRSNCYEQIRMEDLGIVDVLHSTYAHVVHGETSKTVVDKHAIWITDEHSKKVIEAMVSISRLRIQCAHKYGTFKLTQEELLNPYLVEYPYEPWSGQTTRYLRVARAVRPIVQHWKASYYCCNLFEDDQLAITEQDLSIALKVTESLDRGKFYAGTPWKFHMHQLRRTVIVNAASSKLVSDQSLQYQAKHESSRMSQYYSRNNEQIDRDPSITREIESTILSELSATISELTGENYISPHGERHKKLKLEFLTNTDAKKLKKLARDGNIFIRRTIIGNCLYRGTCDKGGVTMVSYCTACSEALISKQNRSLISRARDSHLETMTILEHDSLLYCSLSEQVEALSHALTLIDAKETS